MTKPCSVFQSTRPLRGATSILQPSVSAVSISIHAPLAGRDVLGTINGQKIIYFNPRAPCGARPQTASIAPFIVIFQSTRPLRGATTNRFPLCYYYIISIHAPLAGRDAAGAYLIYFRNDNFNPRAPCGARPTSSRSCNASSTFQSTRPLRGATASTRSTLALSSHFNPRAPCGARHKSYQTYQFSAYISIHAPLAGRDL